MYVVLHFHNNTFEPYVYMRHGSRPQCDCEHTKLTVYCNPLFAVKMTFCEYVERYMKPQSLKTLGNGMKTIHNCYDIRLLK